MVFASVPGGALVNCTLGVFMRKITRFDGGASKTGDSVEVRCKTDDRTQIEFAIERDKVSWVISKLAEWTKDAAKLAGWKAQPIVGHDDSGIWLRPTRYGLVEAKIDDEVLLVIDVGPTRLRVALTKAQCHQLGTTLTTVAVDSDHPQ